MRFSISIWPFDFIFSAHNASFYIKLEALKGAATCEKQKTQPSAYTALKLLSVSQTPRSTLLELRRLGGRGSSDG
jgi:hypothetical protein